MPLHCVAPLSPTWRGDVQACLASLEASSSLSALDRTTGCLDCVPPPSDSRFAEIALILLWQCGSADADSVVELTI